MPPFTPVPSAARRERRHVWRPVMHIRFFATIRQCTGVAEIRWDDPTPSLRELLHALSDRYGPEFRRWVLDGDDLGKVVLVVINGHDARHHGGIDARLRAEDTVAIFPAIAGGKDWPA